jgi:hypothetical protein
MRLTAAWKVADWPATWRQLCGCGMGGGWLRWGLEAALGSDVRVWVHGLCFGLRC